MGFYTIMSIVKIAGFWELGWNTPIKEIELWEFLLREFGVETFYMTPITGIRSSFVQERASLEEILEENKDFKIVFCDERAEISLVDFKHPSKALYVFGKANFSPLLVYKKEKDLAVKIDTVENKGLLWPHQAASIILYDRFLKWQLR